jgi:hypothetical protein
LSERACSRLWEAEALEDGRLAGADRASFERHATSCAECRRELADLASLRARIALVSAPSSTALERQRLRSQILVRANEAVARPRSRTIRLSVAAVISLAALGTIVGRAVSHREQAPDPSAVAPVPPRFDAQSSVDARWLPHTSGAATRVDLSYGSVSFRVPHLEPTQKFSVALPDGELEVRGSAFTIVADGERTVAVNVTEGVVALRIRGRPEVLLNAGDLWPEPTVVGGAASVAMAPAPPPTHSSHSAPRPSPGALFDDAFASFEHGDYRAADRKLERFVHEHPTEPRAEDAAYLRAVARFRLGDRQGAAVLARAYLDAYPAGLRRLEAQRLATTTEP